MQNPIIKFLIKNKFLKKKNLILFSNKTRNKNIKVFRDKKSKIILLSKYEIEKNYYENKYDLENIDKKKYTSLNLNKKKINFKTNNDDSRRYRSLKKYFKPDFKLLDFGCGNLSFLKQAKKKLNIVHGVEIKKIVLDRYKENQNFIIRNDLDKFDYKFDLITMFHTLHYLPNQIDILKKIKDKLKKNGKLYVEVPNANDLLFSLNEFKNFSLCKESLIWHTKESLIFLLNKSGFNKIKCSHFQRFGLNNHLYWFISKKPGGHHKYNFIKKDKINKFYTKELENRGLTDTLILEAING